MNKYLIKAVSEFNVNEVELKDYIDERNIEWGDDRPDQIKSLIENGTCILKDDTGVTQITILKVQDD